MMHPRTATALTAILALVTALVPATTLAASGNESGSGDLSGAIFLLLAAGLVTIGLRVDHQRPRSDP